jgi:hypothetical protein
MSSVDIHREEERFSLVQVRLVGVAYWQKLLGDERHIVGHGQIRIYDTSITIRDGDAYITAGVQADHVGLAVAVKIGQSQISRSAPLRGSG